MNPVDILDSVLEQDGAGDTPASVRALVNVAREVADAFAEVRLDREDHDRIYARALSMLEDAVQEQRRGWQRVLHLEHPAPAVVGGAAALTIGAAALGWMVFHGRRSSRPIAA